MATYLIRHVTRYSYRENALESLNLGCLRPRSFPGQTVQNLKLTVDPAPSWEQTWTDVYGNNRDSFSLSDLHNHLDVTVMAEVQVEPTPYVQSELNWEAVVLPNGNSWMSAPPLMREFCCPSPQLPMPAQPGFECEACFTPGRNVVDALLHFMDVVYTTFTYDPKATTTFTPLSEVYEKKAGVCQDFAHAAIAELRRRGFAAGYVSGYLETVPPAGQEKLRGSDATHAWYAVFIPGMGWVHFDPTNNVIPGERHIVSAWGRDYGDVAPLKGVLLGGGTHKIKVEVDVWSSGQIPPDMQGVFG
jgi:transglutaminase-like putative cysteine protease